MPETRSTPEQMHRRTPVERIYFAWGGRPESQRRGGAPREMLAARKPPGRTYHRSGYLTDGKRLIWEYPRDADAGEQMDFVEVMELDDDGLIRRHCVYWGWFGVGVLQRDEYPR